MVQSIVLPSFKDPRGILTVVEKILPFHIHRVYFIYETNELSRAGHRHVTGQQALICLHKTCRVEVKNSNGILQFPLNDPSQCLILEAEDWHELKFEEGAILLVLASDYYRPENYIY
jgi:WxcM-like, C-terminal